MVEMWLDEVLDQLQEQTIILIKNVVTKYLEFSFQLNVVLKHEKKLSNLLRSCSVDFYFLSSDRRF